MVLLLVLFIGTSVIWGAAGFATGYRLAQRRTPIRFIQGMPPPMPLSNTVKRGPGPGEEQRRWESPSWSAENGSGAPEEESP